MVATTSLDATDAPRPNFFIVGAPKCGTTAWVRYLSGHPDIFFPKVKEPHFFSPDLPPTEEHFASVEEYLALFGGRREKIIGEASVRYLYSKVAAAAIRTFDPEARIVIFLRDQADYLRSRHNQALYAGIEHITDFQQAWNLSRRGMRNGRGNHRPDAALLDYVAWGRFNEQVERYFREFPERQIRIFHFDDWSRAPRETYLEILRFLGLEDDGRTDFPPVNEAKHHKRRFIVDLVRAPPKPIVFVVNLLRRLTGRSGLGIANFLFRLDTRKGSASRLSPALRDEIEAFYRADNALIEHHIWRPGSSARGAVASNPNRVSP